MTSGLGEFQPTSSNCQYLRGVQKSMIPHLPLVPIAGLAISLPTYCWSNLVIAKLPWPLFQTSSMLQYWSELSLGHLDMSNPYEDHLSSRFFGNLKFSMNFSQVIGLNPRYPKNNSNGSTVLACHYT